MRDELLDSRRECRGVRILRTYPVSPSDTSSRAPPLSRVVTDRLPGRHRLQRHEPEVLVERHEQHRDRLGVQIEQRFVGDGSQEADS